MTEQPRLIATYSDEVIVTDSGLLLRVTTVLLSDADTGEPVGAMVPVVTQLRDDDPDDRRRWTSRDW